MSCVFCKAIANISSSVLVATFPFRQGGDRFASMEIENGFNDVVSLREKREGHFDRPWSVSPPYLFNVGDLRAPLYLAITRSRVVVGERFVQTFCVVEYGRIDSSTYSGGFSYAFLPELAQHIFSFSSTVNRKVVPAVL